MSEHALYIEHSERIRQSKHYKFVRSEFAAIRNSYDRFVVKYVRSCWDYYSGTPVVLELSIGCITVCGIEELRKLEKHAGQPLHHHQGCGMVISCLHHKQNKNGEHAYTRKFASDHGFINRRIVIANDKERDTFLDRLMYEIGTVLRRNGFIVLQCMGGRHRAVYLAVLILIVFLGLTLHEASVLVQLIRPQAQLAEFVAGHAEATGAEWEMQGVRRLKCLESYVAWAQSDENDLLLDPVLPLTLAPLEVAQPPWSYRRASACSPCHESLASYSSRD